MRVLPSTEGPAAFFWTSGRDGHLRFLQCAACEYFVHPPAPVCPQCLGRDLAPDIVSGRATLLTFTVNHHPWDGGEVPYAIGIVELDEQPGLRLMTNIIGVEPDDVRIGMRLEVEFEDNDPVFLPLFRPVAE